MAKGYKELPESIKSLDDGEHYYRYSLEPLLNNEGKPNGVVIQNDDNGKFWNGERFSKHIGLWFESGSDKIRKNFEDAKEISDQAKLTITREE